MRARTGALLLCALLACYLLTLSWRGVLLVRDGRPAVVALGVALIVLPLLGAWAMVREVRFGAASQRLAGELERSGGLPPDDMPRTPAGRPDTARLDPWFARFRSAVEADEQDWAAWFRLSCAYDSAGDRKRARAAMRHAITLHPTPPRRDQANLA